MNIDVSLRSCIRRWAFEGSSNFSEWLIRTPWLAQGGYCVLKITKGESSVNFLESAKKSVYAENTDSTELAVAIVSLDPNQGSAWDGMLNELGIPTDSGLGKQTEILSRKLNKTTTVIILEPTAVGSAEWFDELGRRVENLNKMLQHNSLTLIIVDAFATCLLQPSFSFENGWPISKILADSNSDTKVVWMSYLHQRIAWECGGNLFRSHRLDEQMYSVPMGHDDILEQVLNKFAKDLETELLEKINSLEDELYILLNSNKPFSQLEESSNFNDWHSNGLIWRPIGSQSFSLCPWVARAIALRPKCRIEPSLLCSFLVCEQLAEEILTICFRAEARIRCELLKNLSLHKTPTEKMCVALKSFQKRRTTFPCYPTPHPLPPADPWFFASLGEILSENSAAASTGIFNSVRLLRNTIAHGHYICWEHVKTARQIKSNLHV